MVYLDNQATTPLDPRVRLALLEALDQVGNPASAEHSFGWEADKRLARSRAHVASLIQADPDEIFFTSGATEANNIGVIGGALAAPMSRRRVLVSSIEHKSVLESAEWLKTAGYSVEVIPVTTCGLIDPASLRAAIDDSVAIVAIMAVNNEIGTIQPVAKLGSIVREHGALFHVDATQASCAMLINVREWGADTLSLSSHKMYGPGGVGALFVANDARWSPAPRTFGGGQEEGLRPGTVPTALCVGFAEAAQIIEAEGSLERAAIQARRDDLENRLRTIRGDLVVIAAQAERHPGCLNVRFPGVEASELLMRLQPKVAASTGSACTSGLIGPSHVLRAIGLTTTEAGECIRFSLGRFTRQEELGYVAEAIKVAIRAAETTSTLAA